MFLLPWLWALLVGGMASPALAQSSPGPVTAPALAAPTATLTHADLTFDPAIGRWRADLAPAEDAATRPVLPADATGTQARLLRSWIAQGTATGLADVFYDNRDGGHSRLSAERFPQLTHIVYDEALRRQRADRSLATQHLFPAPVLGNASLAITSGPQARSLPRLAMTSAGGANAAAVGYFNNHLYVYPAHMDVRNGADVLPAMLPYFAISYGSSHSDRPVLDVLALALASLRPETRARAEAEGLLAPTLTMLLRRSLHGATTDYLSPAAHPAAIERRSLRPTLAMSAAQAIGPDDLPPVVMLRVLEESFRDTAGLLGRSERLFDSPAAVARLWRGWEGRQEMVVSTAGTRDPSGRALEMHWVLVSGDAERVRITPLDPSGRRARLEIDWHDAPFEPTPGAYSRARVEIAAIAWNGAQYSAPSFVTVAFPSHQRRVHAPGPDGVPQLVSVDYDAEAREVAFDPALWWQAPWTDTAIRDDLGRMIGWRREERSGASQVISPAGFGHYALRNADTARPTLSWSEPAR